MARGLTTIAVANAMPKATRREIPDPGCAGLHLVVQPSGKKSWAVRYRIRGQPKKLTLGPVASKEPPDAVSITGRGIGDSNRCEPARHELLLGFRYPEIPGNGGGEHQLLCYAPLPRGSQG